MLTPQVFQLIASEVILTFPSKKKKQLKVENLEPKPDGHTSYLVLRRHVSTTNQNERGRWKVCKWCLKNAHIDALIAQRILEFPEKVTDVFIHFFYFSAGLHVQRGQCAWSTTQ